MLKIGIDGNSLENVVSELASWVQTLGSVLIVDDQLKLSQRSKKNPTAVWIVRKWSSLRSVTWISGEATLLLGRRLRALSRWRMKATVLLLKRVPTTWPYSYSSSSSLNSSSPWRAHTCFRVRSRGQVWHLQFHLFRSNSIRHNQQRRGWETIIPHNPPLFLGLVLLFIIPTSPTMRWWLWTDL